MTYFFSCKCPSSTTVPKAGKRLLETVAKFLISPLERLRNRKGRGDLVSDHDIVVDMFVNQKNIDEDRQSMYIWLTTQNKKRK